jgi:hypothetical protein
MAFGGKLSGVDPVVPDSVPELFAKLRVKLNAREQTETVRLATARESFTQSLTDDELQIYERCADFPHGFGEWLRHWEFVNRETGERMTFGTLWPGQEEAAARMIAHPWLFLLKAGKLGFTELECAWDAYVLRFAQQRARVNAFSKDKNAAEELVGVVRHGLINLPPFLAVELLEGQAGGDTTRSLKVRPVEADDEYDIRQIQAYAASTNPSIDVSATHAHVDELSHMTHAKDLWGSVSTTVAPHGSCHIVTRGAGDDKYSAELWETAMLGRHETTFELLPGRTPTGRLVPYFANWRGRSDRDEAWYEAEKDTRTLQRLLHYAPNTPADALAGDDTAMYIPIELWDACRDETLPPLMPGDRDAVVLAMDAGVSSDLFAIVLATRHPDSCPCGRTKDDPALRAVRTWAAPPDGTIDYGPVGDAEKTPEDWIRMVAFGGCMRGHPNTNRAELSVPPAGETCDACANGDRQPGFNLVQITYDSYQLHDMATRLRRAGASWVDEFPQGSERLIADGDLHKLAIRRRLAHNGNATLREHVGNAKAKLQADEESKMRIVKRAPAMKVDAAVAASMATKRVLDLNL